MTSVWHDHATEYPKQPLTANKPIIVYPKGSIHKGTKDMNMPEETKQAPEWISLGDAANRDDVPVTRESLRQMIKRGDVPQGHWMKAPMGSGKKFMYLIDVHILDTLPYITDAGRPRTDD